MSEETSGTVKQEARRKKFPWVIYFVVLAVILIVAFAPVGSVVLASVVASSNGCHVDEGSVHPCVIAGKDYGETLYTLGVLGWMMLLTLPAGAIAGLIWLIALLVHRAQWKKRQRVAG